MSRHSFYSSNYEKVHITEQICTTFFCYNFYTRLRISNHVFVFQTFIEIESHIAKILSLFCPKIYSNIA